MMKKILIVYNTMCIGGSTTSLLSLLKYLNYDKYDVDFVLASDGGEWFDFLPDNIHKLEPLWPPDLHSRKSRSLKCIGRRLIASAIAINSKKKKNVIGQIMSHANVDFCRELTECYDIAISFLENFPLDYVATKVKAKKKIAWIHIDYAGAGFIPWIDRKYYANFDRIVLVSEECKRSFNQCFPELTKHSVVIKNILSTETTREMAKCPIEFSVDEQYCNIVTVCRITFAHKGLDRVVRALSQMDQDEPSNRLRWYVIGNGDDFDMLKEMVAKAGLQHKVFLLGEKSNPLPYEVQMDAFLLPSRYEGMPMAVTEAQMLGVPPVVTHYASATDQICNGVDGLIVNNSEDGVYQALRMLTDHPEVLKNWKEKLLSKDVGNESEMQKFETMLDE